MSKFCSECGSPLGDNDTRCPRCGAPTGNNGQQGSETGPDSTAQHSPIYQAASTPNSYSAPAKKKMSTGKLVGIVAGCCAAAVVATLAICFIAFPSTNTTETAKDTGSTEVAANKSSDSTKKDDSKSDSDDKDKDKNVTVNVNVNGGGGDTQAAPAQSAPATTSAPANTSNDGYILPDSASRVYSVSELQSLGLSRTQLTLAKNEIYARHGRGFATAWIRNYFQSKSWYHETYSAQEGFNGRDARELNSVETQNIANLKKAGAE